MDDDIPSPFNSALTGTSGTSDTHPSWNVPPALSPTVVQIRVPHHPWLDCFPFPQVRDNIIRVAQLFNDCDLCTDIMDPANGGCRDDGLGRPVASAELGSLRVVCAQVVVGYQGLSGDYLVKQFLEGATGIEEA
ncbi:hypothetical protein BJY00DRAFT_294277 [Aspergillus carlsbadensis]|nr:hypothetical protein BJY00DRAFT_294277 [Aspergillus carlsbadensis]